MNFRQLLRKSSFRGYSKQFGMLKKLKLKGEINFNSRKHYSSNFSYKSFLNSPDKYLNGIKTEELLERTNVGETFSRTFSQTFSAKMLFFQPLIIMVASATGLPMWAVIALLSSGLRLATTPLGIMGSLEEMKKEKFSEELEHFNVLQRTAKTKEEKQNYQMQYYLFLKNHNIKEWKKLLGPLSSLPIYIPFFLSLKNIITKYPHLLETSGMLWFPNLCLPDPYFILPILNAFLIYLNMKETSKISNSTKIPKTAMILSSLLSGAFTCKFASAYFMFWIPMQIVGLLSSKMFEKYKTRKLEQENFDTIQYKNEMEKLKFEEQGFSILDSEKLEEI